MYRRVLVPLDGSELAERVLPYVERLARRFNGEVILFTACAPEMSWDRPFRAYLEKRAEELASLGVQASPLLVGGNAAAAILEFAEKNDVGLIVISTHGQTGPCGWAMGSVANKVIRESHIPVLMIRPGDLESAAAERDLPKILVPLDGSPSAEVVLPHVAAIARAMNSEVVLLRVIEPVEAPRFAVAEAGVRWEDYEREATEKTERRAQHYLHQQENALRKQGIRVSSVSLKGKAAQTILQYADDAGVSLIALATHGYSGITRWAYGSVASKVLEVSSKPVLLMRSTMSPAERR